MKLQVPKRKEFDTTIKAIMKRTRQVIEESSQKAHLEGDSKLVIQTEGILKEYINECVKNGEYVLDLETTGLDYFNDKIVGVCLYTPGQLPAYIPIHHTDLELNVLPGQLDELLVSKELRRLKNCKAINHNMKFDEKFMQAQWGQGYGNIYWDTLVAGKLLNENETSHGLKYLWARYVGKTKDKQAFKELFDKVPFNFIPIETASIYGANDGLKTYQLYQFQAKYLSPDVPRSDFKELYKLYSEVEIPLINVLVDMELTGVQLDMNKAKELQLEYSKVVGESRQVLDNITNKVLKKIKANMELERLIGKPTKDSPAWTINYNSSTQKSILLYDILEFPVVVKKKPRTTGKEALEAWDNMQLTNLQEQFLKAFKDWMKFHKLLNDFIKKLPKAVEPKTNAVHTEFNQVGTRCIVGSSLIPTPKGYFTISDLCGDIPYNTMQPRECMIVNRYQELERATYVVRFEKQDTIRLSLGYGLSIEGTKDHPILVDGEFKQLKDVSVGDYVDVPLGYNTFSTQYVDTGLSIVPSRTYHTRQVRMPKVIDEDFAEFLGMYFADGSVHDSDGSWGIRISNKDPQVIDRASSLITKLFGLEATVQWSHTTWATGFSCIQLRQLEKYLQRGAYNKIIPKEIQQSPKTVICSFIRGLTLDSTYDRTRQRLAITQCRSENRDFIQQVLLNIGIVTSQLGARLCVTKEHYHRFLSEVGVIQERKKDLRILPRGCKEKIKNNTLSVKVKSIAHGKEDVFDFHVPDTHSFISSGVVSHNTGRFSSSHPLYKVNLQQIPSRGGHKKIRTIFSARPGKVFVGSDFS